jgi:hypothetical protein
MGPPAPGFVLGWDVVPFDAAWVLLPGLALLGLGAALFSFRGRARRRRRLLAASSAAVVLLAVWWTLGGVGAWRMGVQRLREGTADFVEGTVEASARTPEGAPLGFGVAGQRFAPAWDALLPPLHATRWPTLSLADGQRVRVWFFGADVLRLELARGQGEWP